jgi:folate-binding protein YgfZ
MDALDRGFHEARGANFRARYGRERLTAYGPFDQEYEALEQASVLLDLSDHARLDLSGEDRVRFLNGLVTQQVATLPPGTGAPACFLDRRSRILAEVRIFATEDSLLLEGEPGLGASLVERLQKYRLSSRVAVADLSEESALLSVQGPLAGETVGAVLGTDGAGLPPYGHAAAAFGGAPLRVFRIPRTGRPGLDLLCPRSHAGDLWRSLAAAGAAPAGWDLLETARTEAGLPRFGADLTEETLFPEARLPGHVSWDKGCYLGQEIVSRVRTYGNVKRVRTGLLVDGAAQPGDSVRVRGREAARLTSARFSPLVGKTCAFAYLHPALGAEEDAQILVGGPEGDLPACVAPFPFL